MRYYKSAMGMMLRVRACEKMLKEYYWEGDGRVRYCEGDVRVRDGVMKEYEMLWEYKTVWKIERGFDILMGDVRFWDWVRVL